MSRQQPKVAREEAPRLAAAMARPQEAAPEPSLLRLQRLLGNRAVVSSLRAAGQASLAVGSAHDPLEAEADAVARSITGLTPRGRSVGPAADAHDSPVPSVGAAGGELDGATAAAIDAARGGGAALPGGVRSDMEQSFGGVDFGGVRVHAGPQAAELNRAVSAEAFTIGRDVFFATPPDLTSRTGQALLAHELTHTVQQGAAPAVAQRAATDDVQVEERQDEAPRSHT